MTLCGLRAGEAHRPPRATLERAVHRSRVRDEVETRPGIAGEKLARQHIAFQAIAATAGEDEVARDVCTAMRERVDVIERREIKLQWRCAIDAAAIAIAHRGALDRALLMPGGDGSAAT